MFNIIYLFLIIGCFIAVFKAKYNNDTNTMLFYGMLFITNVLIVLSFHIIDHINEILEVINGLGRLY